jgi:hypothetical protein
MSMQTSVTFGVVHFMANLLGTWRKQPIYRPLVSKTPHVKAMQHVLCAVKMLVIKCAAGVGSSQKTSFLPQLSIVHPARQTLSHDYRGEPRCGAREIVLICAHDGWERKSNDINSLLVFMHTSYAVGECALRQFSCRQVHSAKILSLYSWCFGIDRRTPALQQANAAALSNSYRLGISNHGQNLRDFSQMRSHPIHRETWNTTRISWEIQMKKILITTAAIAMLATSSIADAKSKTSMSHYQFMLATQQMINKQMKELTSFQRLLKQMMENESSTHHG